jgi:hypothetical protein
VTAGWSVFHLVSHLQHAIIVLLHLVSHLQHAIIVLLHIVSHLQHAIIVLWCCLVNFVVNV